MISTKSDYDFKKSIIASMSEMASRPNISFIEKLNLESRIKMIKQELEKLNYDSLPGIKSIVFKGDAVYGQHGIRADFVSKALGEIQGIVTDFFEIISGTTQNQNVDLSKLMVTDIVRGSFGFEFEPVAVSDKINMAVSKTTEILSMFSQKTTDIKRGLEGLQPKTLNRITRLVDELHRQNSKLIVNDGFITINMDEKVIEKAVKVLKESSTKDKVIELTGFFYILPASGAFEVMSRGKTYHGKLSKTQLSKQLDFFNANIGKKAKITLIKTVKSGKLKTEEPKYRIKGIIPEVIK